MNRILSVSLVLGLILVGCSKKEETTGEISKEETQQFITNTADMQTTAETSEAGVAAADLLSHPPDWLFDFGEAGLSSNFGLNKKESYLKLLSTFQNGIDTLYGTWEYDTLLNTWLHTDTLNPSNGILLKWYYHNETTGELHLAELLFDSIGFFNDTLVESMHISLSSDGNELAELSFGAEYTQDGSPTSIDFTIELIDYFTFHISIEATGGGTLEDEPFVGTVSGYIIDHTNSNYRLDYSVTSNADSTVNITVSDSDGWEVTLNFSAPVPVSEADPFYIGERIDVTGEIKKNGIHAADIWGEIWDPEDNNHTSEIFVGYPDGSEDPLSVYFGF